MTTSQTILLGAIAGFTIFLGLPVGRLRTTDVRLRTFLSGLSAGVLAFLFVEVMEHAFGPVEEALEHANEGSGSWVTFAGTGAVFVIGFGAGLLALLAVLRATKPSAEAPQSVGPGAMAVAELEGDHFRHRQSLRLGMSIAAAIGVHNFAEGLAIGQSAAAGDSKLALLLVIGFALHNATEGFGIVGPLTAPASWRWLLLAGVVGGGPTFLGTLVGRTFSSEILSVAFLAVAGGAILYVVGELMAGGRRRGWNVLLWGTFVGYVLGVGTELVLELAG